MGGCLVTSVWWHSWAGCMQASIVESHLRTSTYQGTHQAWHALCLSEASWMTCTLIVKGLVRFFAPPKSALAAIFSKHIRHVWNWQILDLGLVESELAFDRCILNGLYSCLHLYLYLYLYFYLYLYLHLYFYFYLYLYPIGGWLRPDAYEMRKCSPCSLLFQMRPDCKGSGQNCMHTNALW